MWSADFSQNDNEIEVSNSDYNNLIKSGSTINFGFLLNYSDSNEVPTDFILTSESELPTNTATTTTEDTTATPTPTEEVTPTETTSSEPSEYDLSNSLIIGRYDDSDLEGPKFAWSASTIKADFSGTGISVGLVSQGDNWFNVIVDDEVLEPINVTSSTSSPINLVSGLEEGEHSIELVKRTECWVGEVQFLGFIVEDGSLLETPKESSRKIEFIGDSITCGYGNEGTDQYQTFTTQNENAYLAYGSIASRILGADQITVSWSGKGIMRNYGGDTTEVLPEIYDRILPYNTDLSWDSSKWIPDVVVINLCTNDYSIGIPDETTFVNAYLDFVQKIREQYPSAYIYCAVGPMLSGDNLDSARTNIQSVVDTQALTGDDNIGFIEFPVQDAANGYGEDWHPSVATHELMAEQLANQIEDDLGW
jgi:lysophospholipase L1-like esterase